MYQEVQALSHLLSSKMPQNLKETNGKTGTQHHCPGPKIAKYARMGNCRGQKENGYCKTHQVPCEVKKCTFARLKEEPCQGCASRGMVRPSEISFGLIGADLWCCRRLKR